MIKYILRNKSNLFLTLLVILFSWYLWQNHYLGELKDSTFHGSLLTVNALLLGFLFTALGIMVGFADKKIIAKLEVGGYMDNYYNAIHFGMIFLSISTIISIIAVVFGAELIINSFLIIQQTTLIGGVMFFGKAFLGLFKIIKRIRKEIRRNHG